MSRLLDRLSKREKILITLLLIFGILALYYYYVYAPTQEEIKQLSAEKRQKQNQFYQDMALVRQLPELRERYDELKEIEKIELKFSRLTPEDFLELIEKISQETDSSLISYIPQEKEEYTVLNITMEGNYKNLNDFLTGLKKLANQLEVNNISIKPDKESLKMKMVLHYKKRSPLGGDST